MIDQNNSVVITLLCSLFTVLICSFGSSHHVVLCSKLSTANHLDPPQTYLAQNREIHSQRKIRDAQRAALLFNETLDLRGSHQNDQPNQCCTCDEAKYELVFEGLWSRYTHPDDFPENYWLAYFSDIIGASHSNEFRIWSQDSYASEGVKELAETGSTKKLESELKQVSSKTRTIIKARELRYPTLNSKTSAVFRTDRQHHLVSILSKLGPSPDWMVGVAGLELCQADCSWINQRIINLFLWDAGTDSGDSFTSSDSPSRPQEKIHPFRRVHQSSTAKPALLANVDMSSYQSGKKKKRFAASPSSWNDQQAYMSNAVDTSHSTSSSHSPEQQKPFARLTITRQRIYEKSCNGDTIQANNQQQQYQATKTYNHNNHHRTINTDSWTMEPTRSSQQSYSDCRFGEWSDWSACSSTCGRGIRTRTRSFLDEQAHLVGCSQIDLIEKELCLSECLGNVTCVTRDWSEWSKCSVDCGQGVKKRVRTLIGPIKRGCESSIELAENESCIGSQTLNGGNCSNDATSCELTEWSQWSDCSVACGKGTKIRTRQYVRKDNVESCSAKLIQKQSCNGRAELCKQSGSNSNKGQNRQTAVVNQDTQTSNPNLPVIDCKLSSWSPWSTCSALCGLGRKTRSRYIIQMPQNGGKPCDRKLSRTQRCKDLPPCPPNFINQNAPSQTNVGHPPSAIRDSYNKPGNQKSNWHQTSTTTAGSMMDDEDDSKFSRLLQSESNKFYDKLKN